VRLLPLLWRQIRTADRVRRAAGGCVGLVILFAAARAVVAEPPVALRMESFVVAPAHSPSAVVVVMNHGQAPYEGSLRLEGPEGWQLSPSEQKVRLAPGEAQRVAFLVKRGTTSEQNSYPLKASITGAGATVTRRQNVVTASAPYFKPTVDGNPDDWSDAIPVTWTTAGRKTVISTYWNRRQFSLLVAVEEDELVRFPGGPGRGEFDAVQVAISPEDAMTGRSPDEEAARYEFLLVSTGGGIEGKCFKLAEPGMTLAEGQKPRELPPLEYAEARVAVSRRAGVTCYECSIPFALMRERIRPSEGREFCLSVLVHDPGGTGIRDWGEAAGLGPSERNRLAWSQWPGAKWGDEPPFDNKTPWGLCSSKY
jgi:hypothetical protein